MSKPLSSDSVAVFFEPCPESHPELLERVDALSRVQADAALKYLRQQLRRAQSLPDKSKKPWTLLFMSMIQRGQRVHSPVLKLLNEAHNLFEALDDKFGLAATTLEISLVNREMDRNTLALQYAHEAINLFHLFPPSIEMAWSYSNLATIYLNRSQPKEGFQAAQKAHEIFQQLKAQDGFGWNACNLANLYLEMGESEKALELYMAALRTFEASNNNQGIAWSSLGLSTVHRRRCLFKQAVVHIEKAEKYFEQLKLKDRVAWCLLHKAALMRAQAEEKQALALNAKALKIFSPAKNMDGMAWCLFQNGQVYRDQAQPIKAWEAFQAGLNLHEHVYNRLGVGWELNEMGKTYLGLNNMALAGECLTKAKTTAYQMNVPSLKADVEKNLANFYFDKGMIEKGRESLELAENFCAHSEAYETQMEICLVRTRYNLLTMNMSAAHASLERGLGLSDTYELSRLRPLFYLCRGELLLMERKINEADGCFQDALTFAKTHGYRYMFMKAPLGFLQIQMARKLLKKPQAVFSPLEKAVKSWGARKLRAKFLAVHAIANSRMNGTLDLAPMRRGLLILDIGGFLLTKLQFLEVFEDLAQKFGNTAEAENFRMQRDQLLKHAPAELRSLPPRKSVFDTIPISLAS